jgi:hypothetical protein
VDEMKIKGLTVTARAAGVKRAIWATKDNTMCHHVVIVKNDVERVKFDYWTSIAKPTIDKSELSDVLLTIVQDALCGEKSFEDFCDEFCYSKDSIAARKTWKACVKINEKLSLVCDISELNKFLEDLSESKEGECDC